MDVIEGDLIDAAEFGFDREGHYFTPKSQSERGR